MIRRQPGAGFALYQRGSLARELAIEPECLNDSFARHHPRGVHYVVVTAGSYVNSAPLISSGDMGRRSREHWKRRRKRFQSHPEILAGCV